MSWQQPWNIEAKLNPQPSQGIQALANHQVIATVTHMMTVQRPYHASVDVVNHVDSRAIPQIWENLETPLQTWLDALEAHWADDLSAPFSPLISDMSNSDLLNMQTRLGHLFHQMFILLNMHAQKSPRYWSLSGKLRQQLPSLTRMHHMHSDTACSAGTSHSNLLC